MCGGRERKREREREIDLPYFAMYDVHLLFWLKLSGKFFVIIFKFNCYLFIFRNKTEDHILGYYFAYGYIVIAF